jgi:hypothetical protein
VERMTKVRYVRYDERSGMRKLEHKPERSEISPWNPGVVGQVREEANVPPVLRGCLDCRHRSGELCGHPSFGTRKLDVFHGRMITVDRPKYRRMRDVDGPCGPDAKLWNKVTPVGNHRNYGRVALVTTGVVCYGVFSGYILSLLLIPIAVICFFLYFALGGLDG